MAGTTNSPVLFKFGTRAQYDALETKQPNALYFLTDTGELLRGEVNLAQAHYFEGILNDSETKEEAIARVTTDITLVKNDVCVIKEQIIDNNYSHTAYVYDGEHWRAMDGNYNAENVYFDENLIFTKDVGYVTVDDSGSATVEAKGKNVKQLFETLFAKELEPIVTKPSLSLTTDQNIAYEVGTVVTPSYSLSFDSGSYNYGPATEITATYSVTNSENSTPQTESVGVFEPITVADDTNYTIIATANYTDGTIPVSNLNNAVAAKQIKAGSISQTSEVLTGYRAFFYGATTAESVTSNVIRNLVNGKQPKAQTLPNYAASSVAGAKQVIVAIPATSDLRVKQVILPSAYHADITSEFILQADPIKVEGINGYEAIDYKVWVYHPALLDPSEVYSIILG